uniref:Uncharacterized protein n=1 Tax=Rhizophora mucronata TaxID=61149 RepID=A0A2P2IU18_RHIMU
MSELQFSVVQSIRPYLHIITFFLSYLFFTILWFTIPF